MSTSENILTREEVREKLAERTASINSRMEALESELPVKAKTVKRLYENKGLIKKGFAVGAGVLVLALLLKRRSSSDNGYSDGLERIAQIISREIRKNIKAGMDTEDAVLLALKKRPPVLRVGGKTSGSDTSSTISIVLKQLAVSLGPALIDMIADILRQSSQQEKEK